MSLTKIITDMIADLAVTAAKLANSAVETAKINNSAVTTEKIADDAVTLGKMEHGTQGDVLYYGASGVPTRLAAGTNGQCLQTQGAGANPQWATVNTSVLVAPVAVTSGTESIIGSIPAGVNWIDIMLNVVSVSSTGVLALQIGDAGGVENTGYAASASYASSSNGQTTYFPLQTTVAAANVAYGLIRLVRMTGNRWMIGGSCNGTSTSGEFVNALAGSKELSATLTQLRLFPVSGNFDGAGEWAIRYGT